MTNKDTIPHSSGGSAICSKHDTISHLASEIIQIVNACMRDGQNMEDRLSERKDEVKELNKKIEELEVENEDLKSIIEDLKKEYESLVKELGSCQERQL